MTDNESKSRLKSVLEEKFKPIFQKHEKAEVTLKDIDAQLEELGLWPLIPETSRKEFAARLSLRPVSSITYKEFVKIIINNQKRQKVVRRMTDTFIGPLLPRDKRKDFLVHYTCWPPPLFIPIVSVVEVTTFVMYVIALRRKGVPVTMVDGFPSDSPYMYHPRRRYEAWRFLSYMLVHKGYLHIVGNVSMQVIFGIPLEMVHKGHRIALVYILGVIAGSLTSSITDPWVSLVGASGGVYAMLGAYIASVIINWKEMNYRCLNPEKRILEKYNFNIRLLLSAPIRLIFFTMLTTMDVGIALYRRYTGKESTRVGIAAHVGGCLAGVFLGVTFLWNMNEATWETHLGRVTFLVFAGFLVVCIFINCTFDIYKETDWSPLNTSSLLIL